MRVASPLVANITCAKGACVRAATTCCTCVKGCVRGATTRCTGDTYEGSARAWRRTCCTCLKGCVFDATTRCTGDTREESARAWRRHLLNLLHHLLSCSLFSFSFPSFSYSHPFWFPLLHLVFIVISRFCVLIFFASLDTLSYCLGR